MGKYLEIKLGEGSRLETDCKLSAKKYPEVMRMDRLLECITQSKKKTIRLILQQFLLWSETKKNQKWLVTLAKAASQAHHSNRLIILTVQTIQFLLPIQGSCSEVKGTGLLLKFLSHLTRQLSRWHECLLS